MVEPLNPLFSFVHDAIDAVEAVELGFTLW
jgi:hypothetical protein